MRPMQYIYICVCVCVYIYIYLFIYLVALGLCCCTQAFSSFRDWWLLSLVVVQGLLNVVASLVAKHRLQAHQLSSCGSRALEHGPSNCNTQVSCSEACGIFPDQGSNPGPLQCQVDSYLLHHQGSPVHNF